MWKDKMIQAGFWSTLFYSISYPFMHIWLMKEVNEKMLSVNSMIICITIIIFNTIWNKHSDKLYKYFPILCILEAITYTIIHLLTICGFIRPALYYIIDTIIFSLITRNLICGGNKLRSLVYKNENREKYDNTIMITNSIATSIGGTIALIFSFPIWVVMIICQIGLVVDNFFYIGAYYEKENSEN